MIRTQVYLPKDLYEEARRVSFERKMSIAGVVREALAEYLVAGKAKPKSVTLEEEREFSEEELKSHPLYQIIGMCSSGLGDGAENHDYYLYGGNRA
jgi:hypothetical protein